MKKDYHKGWQAYLEVHYHKRWTRWAALPIGKQQKVDWKLSVAGGRVTLVANEQKLFEGETPTGVDGRALKEHLCLYPGVQLMRRSSMRRQFPSNRRRSSADCVWWRATH